MIHFPSQQPGANLLPVIRRHRLLFAVAAIAAFASGDEKLRLAAEKAPFAPTLVLVDDSTVPAPSLTIANDRIRGNGVPADLALDDLKQIINHGEDDDLPGYLIAEASVVVYVSNGGRVWAKKATIANEKIKIEWQSGPPLDLPIDLLRGLEIDVRAASSDFEKSLAVPPPALDRVLIKNEDGPISSISGLVESLDADTVTLDVNAVKRSVARSRLTGMVFAQPAPSNQKPLYTVKFRDGSELTGDKFSLTEGKATLEIAPQAVARFNWPDVYEVSVRSTRLAYLSDWPSLKEEQTPIVTPPFPAQRDKSVSGGRLQVGHLERFEKGLGVHARSAITFTTEGKWDIFKAKIGLDEEADGKGDCIFQVLADGKSIFQRRISGRDLGTAEVKLPITGCQELTLLVEPGEGLDMADHANWCDARLIKAKR